MVIVNLQVSQIMKIEIGAIGSILTWILLVLPKEILGQYLHIMIHYGFVNFSFVFIFCSSSSFDVNMSMGYITSHDIYSIIC